MPGFVRERPATCVAGLDRSQGASRRPARTFAARERWPSSRPNAPRIRCPISSSPANGAPSVSPNWSGRNTWSAR
ncbi:hypothetical protein [Lysobacter gummosus]|uniref:hypothetical protein n=1 Tax=Lysobacter gummosus TaxID=262324 RepID=UPI003628F18E